MSESPESIASRDGLGETPLHYLTVENQIESVKFLIENGAEVNTISDVKDTPLSEAASLGYAEMVSLLLKNGAKLDFSGQEEKTILEGVKSGNVEVIKLLLNSGADISTLDSLKNTALHVAAEDDNRSEALKFIIDLSAELNPSKKGSSIILTLLKFRSRSIGQIDVGLRKLGANLY